MSAKSRNEPKYKPFIGRMFTLRKHKKIPGYPTTPNIDRTEYTHEHFGEVVLVLDETNTQVRVSDKYGKTVWISKFFLHKEINNKQFINVDTLVENIFKILTSTKNIKEKLRDSNAKNSVNKELEELENIANNLRMFADKLEPLTK